MAWVVVSETVRRIRRDESYSLTPGPAIPGGTMHGKEPGSGSTLCNLDVASLHEWPLLDFPRAFGPHCDACVAVTGAAVPAD